MRRYWRRRSARARGSCWRSFRLSSRSSLRRLARRAGSSEPAEISAAHGAAGLAVVLAVVEAAVLASASMSANVASSPPSSSARAQLAHAGRVEDEAPAGDPDEVPPGGRMATAGVVLADRRRRLDDLAGQRVDQRRLAHARRAHEGRGATLGKPVAEGLEAESGRGADGVDRRPAGDRLDPGDRTLRVVRQVGLVQDDDRSRPGAPGQREIALEPARVQVVVERGDDEQRVDVRRQHLLTGGSVARRPADDRGPAREETLDEPVIGLAGRLERDPVPDDREAGVARDRRRTGIRPDTVARASPSASRTR